MSVFATAVCAPSPTRNQPALATESSLVRTWAEVILRCQSVLVGIIAKLLIQQCRKVAEWFKAPVLKCVHGRPAPVLHCVLWSGFPLLFVVRLMLSSRLILPRSILSGTNSGTK